MPKGGIVQNPPPEIFKALISPPRTAAEKKFFGENFHFFLVNFAVLSQIVM